MLHYRIIHWYKAYIYTETWNIQTSIHMVYSEVIYSLYLIMIWYVLLHPWYYVNDLNWHTESFNCTWHSPCAYTETLWNLLYIYIWFHDLTRSTQRAQTSLAETDHYSHIAHCKNVEPWLWKTTHLPKKKKKKKKVLDHYLHHDLGMLPLLRCFFAHLLILQYPDHHQNLISSSLYYSGPVHKISSQSIHNFLSNVVHRQTNRQTDRQTNQRYQKHKFLSNVVHRQTNRQTDRQTNQRYQKHNLLCQGGNNKLMLKYYLLEMLLYKPWEN